MFYISSEKIIKKYDSSMISHGFPAKYQGFSLAFPMAFSPLGTSSSSVRVLLDTACCAEEEAEASETWLCIYNIIYIYIIYIYISIYIYIYISIYIYVYIYDYICICICIYVYVYMCVWWMCMYINSMCEYLEWVHVYTYFLCYIHL